MASELELAGLLSQVEDDAGEEDIFAVLVTPAAAAPAGGQAHWPRRGLARRSSCYVLVSTLSAPFASFVAVPVAADAPAGAPAHCLHWW